MADELALLLPFKWRGFDVPCGPNDWDFSHRNVEHEECGVNGAHIEGTGRKAAGFNFRLYFRNGIAGYTGLYPQSFYLFMDAFLDGSAGPLQHPDLGVVDCKPGTWKCHYDPNRRDGVDVDVTFKETIENVDALDSYDKDPTAASNDAAQHLDELLGQYPDLDTYDDGSGDTPASILKKLQSALILAQLSVADAMAQIEGIIDAANNLTDTVQGLATEGSIPIAQASKALIDALLDSLEKMQPVANAVGLRVDLRATAQELTAQAASALYSTPLDDLFALNPQIGASDVIPSGTDLHVYVKT